MGNKFSLRSLSYNVDSEVNSSPMLFDTSLVEVVERRVGKQSTRMGG